MRSEPNRTEGRAALLALATAQEKFYLQCNTYATAGSHPAESQSGEWRNRQPEFPYDGVSAGITIIAVTGADATGWTAEVAPAAESPQLEGRRSASCSRLANTGQKYAEKIPAAPTTRESCWGK